MKFAIFAALVAALAAPPSVHGAAPEPARLVLSFEVGAETGAVMVSLFDSEAAFPRGAAVRQARIDIASGERTAVFAGLPPGFYAATAFQDLDGDGRMGANPFGVPTEPFAFSNNARVNMGPPSWGSARFAVEGEAAHTIILR